MKQVVWVMILVIVLFASQISLGQQEPAHPGIVYFENGNYDDAVSSLEAATKTKERRSDPVIWNVLGLAYLRKNNAKKARRPLETAVRLSPSNSDYRTNLAYAYFLNVQYSKARAEAENAIALDPTNVAAYRLRGTARMWNLDFAAAEQDADAMLRIDPKFPHGYSLKADIIIARLSKQLSGDRTIYEEVGLLKQALDVLTEGVKNCKGTADTSRLEKEQEAMSVFYTHFSRDRSNDPPPGSPPPPGVTPYRIISKPKAQYTNEARAASRRGSIKLHVLLGASGNVEHILLVKRLGYGLDEQAVRAARQIKFEPKQIDGRPVSTVVTIEYGFDIFLGCDLEFAYLDVVSEAQRYGELRSVVI